MSRSAGAAVQQSIRSKTGALTAAAPLYLGSAADAEAEPATPEPTAAEAEPTPTLAPSAPAPTTPGPEAPPASGPAAAGPSGEVPLPPVSVEAGRRRPPARVQTAPATPAVTTPPPPTTTVAAPPALGPTPYQVTNTGITRLPVPLLNTPQTVNVIPQAIIQEQRITTVEDALRYVPGITFSAGEGAQQGDAPIIRGFVARGDLFRDGIRDPGWYTRDAFSIDRVEVFKGPSAFAFGRGATGGAINYVTKLPTGAQYLEATVSGTTGPGYRVEIDTSGSKDNIWGRIAAVYTDIDTPTRDSIWTKRWGVAPSGTYDFKQGTKATLSYVYQGEEGVPDYGVTYLPMPVINPLTGAFTSRGYYGDGRPVTPLPVPRETFYGIPYGVPGSPFGDITRTETHIATFKVEHEFDKDLKIVNASRYIDNDRFSLPTAPRAVGNAANVPFGNNPPPFYPVELMTIGRERRMRDTGNTYAVNQTDLVGKFRTWSLEHKVAAGIEAAYETRHQDRTDICDPVNILCRTTVINPGNGSPTGGLTLPFKPIDTKARDYAAYVSDQMKINEHLELLASLRYDRFSTVYDDPNQVVPANRHLETLDKLFSYRFGAVIHPTKRSSVYVAYGNSYNPSAELGTIPSATSAALPPEQTRTIEIGSKVDLRGGKLSLSAAVFKIEKMNLRINNPFDNTTQILDGLATVTGTELGAVGQVTDQWSVFGGYSYLESEISDTRDRSILGKHLQNTPRHNFTLWTTYELTKQFTVGGGAIYQSLGWSNNMNTAYVPEYWKFDAMFSYKVTDKSTVQLNINNLTNTYYYSQYFGSNVVPASGRWAALTYRQRW